MSSIPTHLLVNQIPCQQIIHKRKEQPEPKSKFKKAKKLEQFHLLAQQNDYKLWKNSEVIAIEAKRYINFNWETDPIAPTAESLLAIAYHASSLSAKNPKENRELTHRIRKRVRDLTYLPQSDSSYRLLMPAIELCRLVKVLNLFSGEEGKDLRAFLYPIIYHCKEARETRSQPEIIQEGINIALYLLDLNDEELLKLSLPSLNNMSVKEQKDTIRCWLTTFQTKAVMLKNGDEALLPHYYANIEEKGEKKIFVASHQFHNQFLAYSHLVESFCIKPLDRSWAQHDSLSTFEIDLPLLEIWECEVNPLFLVAVRQDYPLADIKYPLMHKRRSVKASELIAEFVKGRLPDLTPTHWPKRVGARMTQPTIPPLADLQQQIKAFARQKEEMEKKSH